MLEIVKAVKAEAEQEIIFAKAKLEVANSILARMEAHTKVSEDFTMKPQNMQPMRTFLAPMNSTEFKGGA